MAREQINLRVDPAIAERLRNLSDATGIKINFILERAVVRELEALEATHKEALAEWKKQQPKGKKGK